MPPHGPGMIGATHSHDPGEATVFAVKAAATLKIANELCLHCFMLHDDTVVCVCRTH
jgi:hypothetical protein